MAKVIYAPLRSAKSDAKNSVRTKQVTSPDGKKLKVHVVDADSGTFSDDISYVFRQNVRKARREQKRLKVGPGDRVAPKD